MCLWALLAFCSSGVEYESPKLWDDEDWRPSTGEPPICHKVFWTQLGTKVFLGRPPLAAKGQWEDESLSTDFNPDGCLVRFAIAKHKLEKPDAVYGLRARRGSGRVGTLLQTCVCMYLKEESVFL